MMGRAALVKTLLSIVVTLRTQPVGCNCMALQFLWNNLRQPSDYAGQLFGCISFHMSAVNRLVIDEVALEVMVA